MKISKSRDASDNLTVSIDKMPVFKYRFIRWLICKQFGLKKHSKYVQGLNERFQTFQGEAGQVSIEWDAWSGFIVSAVDKDSETLLEQIHSWLEKRYKNV